MKKILFIKTIAIFFILLSSLNAKESKNFDKGVKLFEKNKFDESKIFFERDIIFNPKIERSYLYLAKIFKEKDNQEEQEVNLTNVLILNPKNDEAIYLLTLLKIKQSDYKEAKDLSERFILVCNRFCSKKNEILNKLNTLNPENE